MSKPKHTPEPWAVSATQSQCEIINQYPRQGKPWELQATAASPENAARIVACVNACAGIADPSVVPEMLKWMADLEDWLANGAGRHACAGWDCATCGRSTWLGQLQELLARAEGKK